MGFNTTVLILNDALGEIEKDKDFGQKLVEAVHNQFSGSGRNTVSCRYSNAATVIEQHHADSTSVVAIGGDTATQLAIVSGYNHHKDEDKLRILGQMANQLGYYLTPIKKPKKKNKSKNHLQTMLNMVDFARILENIIEENMSYIRSLSNPEGLYILGSTSGNVEIYEGSLDCKTIPQEVWNGLFAKLEKDSFDQQDNHGEYAEYKGFRIYDFANVAAIDENWPTFETVKEMFNPAYKSKWRVRMQYADWKIDMWYVTFQYIYENTLNRPPNPAPWKVLTGWYFYKIIRNKISYFWWKYLTNHGRDYRTELKNIEE